MLPDGRAIKAGLFARLPAGGSDGLALDVEGNLAVANPGFGVVWLFNRKGLPLYRIDSPAGDHLTNMAYGGPDNRWLYVVEGDSFSILRVEMPFPGRPMFSHLPP
jgi:gluconolactonase